LTAAAFTVLSRGLDLNAGTESLKSPGPAAPVAELRPS
jgi:hypothetical protein